MSQIKLKFPENFLWGAATSAYQVEGGNKNNWSEWEKANAKRLTSETKKKWQKWQQEKFPEMFEEKNYISGRACDHYNRYEEDFDIAKQLGHNAHRFSIEWSRIEPEEGKFDEKEIEHYRKVLKALRARKIEPFVTLWHWTNPLWLKNGELNKKFPKYFSRYVKFVIEKLGDLNNFWITLNEPTSVIFSSYIQGAWPPQKRNPFKALCVYKNLAAAHNLTYSEIHRIAPQAKVGFSNIMIYIEPTHKWHLLEKLIVKISDYFSNRKFLKMTNGNNDFLAIQYYFHKKISFFGMNAEKNKNVSDLDWDISPEGIYPLLKSLKKYNLPIYITENGLADKEDKLRSAFIKEHLKWIHRAIAEKVDVRGYFYWSLLDNFEWDKGFWPRFGLVEINYETLERKIRPSAWEYKKIIEANGIIDESKS